ncbi:MAG: M1 family metallopeptidase [Bacteroidales bacterium]|nr:M1 family metallopeptidase [Bacteroidales bacterium]
MRIKFTRIIKFQVLSILFLLTASPEVLAQELVFNHQDTLRGSITPEREWWDLSYYHLDIKVDPADRSIKGSNLVRYKVLKENQLMQIDLQPPMKIKRVTQDGNELSWKRDGNAWFIKLQKIQDPGQSEEIVVWYEGKPKLSENPPWSGGISWEKDGNGNDFIASACQGDGASLWWPCKDHPYDEPDSMLISVNVPGHLTDVSNGRLRGVDEKPDGTQTFHWFVSNPINNYGVNINIADYVHFSEKYRGEKGILDCDYWVLNGNMVKAKEHFKDVKRMLEAFEYWFGPYPFYEDSYKLVEVSYLGMEHQSSVTYGNGFKKGYRGRDLSQTGWGLKFDFIIVHESGHEWFANSITNWDVADMWIHESFIAYSENLFLDYFYGKEASAAYVRGTRANIRNDRSIIGIYDVNYEGSGDMYYKGANMLHMLRQLVDDDEEWRQILRAINKKYYHQTVKGEQIEAFLSEQTGIDLSAFFDQYLRDTRIPVLEYVIEGEKVKYRWDNCVKGFDMPLRVEINGVINWINPGRRWNSFTYIEDIQSFVVDPDFYVASFNLMGNYTSPE